VIVHPPGGIVFEARDGLSLLLDRVRTLPSSASSEQSSRSNEKRRRVPS
jgi:hypothetical protein